MIKSSIYLLIFRGESSAAIMSIWRRIDRARRIIRGRSGKHNWRELGVRV